MGVAPVNLWQILCHVCVRLYSASAFANKAILERHPKPPVLGSPKQTMFCHATPWVSHSFFTLIWSFAICSLSCSAGRGSSVLILSSCRLQRNSLIFCSQVFQVCNSKKKIGKKETKGGSEFGAFQSSSASLGKGNGDLLLKRTSMPETGVRILTYGF